MFLIIRLICILRSYRMNKSKYCKSTLINSWGAKLNYNSELLRVATIESDYYRTNIELEPIKLNEESLDELAKTIVRAEKKFNPINPEDYPIMVVDGHVTSRANCAFCHEVAEPKDYTILGVKIRYDKEIGGFVTPDGMKNIPCTSTNLIEFTPTLPDMEVLYKYVLNYKINMYSNDKEFLQGTENGDD